MTNICGNHVYPYDASKTKSKGHTGVSCQRTIRWISSPACVLARDAGYCRQTALQPHVWYGTEKWRRCNCRVKTVSRETVFLVGLLEQSSGGPQLNFPARRHSCSNPKSSIAGVLLFIPYDGKSYIFLPSGLDRLTL
jgi:hypothetical protein